jgi:hypothetical protein
MSTGITWTLPIPVEVLLTWAWQRWELELVHREVKPLLGFGDKQRFNARCRRLSPVVVPDATG